MDPHPPDARPPDAVLERFVAFCREDERIVAGILGGSHARGTADRHSDLDLCVFTTDAAYEEVMAERAAIVERLGRPLFLESFGRSDIAFFILADGTEAELMFEREGGLEDLVDVGPYRTLVDKQGILAGRTFPDRGPDRAEQTQALQRSLHWFWHELSHFIAAVGRGHLWWASGQLEALRGHCVNLIRIEQGVAAEDEPYEKVDTVIPAEELSELTDTVGPLGRDEMVRAAVRLVEFHHDRGPAVAASFGVPYPDELARLMRGRLDTLVSPAP